MHYRLGRVSPGLLLVAALALGLAGMGYLVLSSPVDRLSTVEPKPEAQKNSATKDTQTATKKKPKAKKKQAPLCPDGPKLRVLVDHSVSMRGFAKREFRRFIGLSELVNYLLNQVEETNRQADLKEVPKLEVVFVGDAAGSKKAPKLDDDSRLAKKGATSCGLKDCAGAKTCCSLHDDLVEQESEKNRLMCLPAKYCGAAKRGTKNEWAVSSNFDASKSRVSVGLEMMFDPCVQTSIFITDGLETPPEVKTESCDPTARTLSDEPGLIKLLERMQTKRRGKGWGSWMMKALLPFDGSVYLECGRTDPPMKRALGARLQRSPKSGELYFQTQGEELQPAFIFMTSKGKRAYIDRLSRGLASRLSQYNQNNEKEVSKGSAKPAPFVAPFQLWPPPDYGDTCGQAVLDVCQRAAGGGAEMTRMMSSQEFGYLALGRVHAKVAPSERSNMQHVFEWSGRKASLRVVGQSVDEPKRMAASLDEQVFWRWSSSKRRRPPPMSVPTHAKQGRKIKSLMAAQDCQNAAQTAWEVETVAPGEEAESSQKVRSECTGQKPRGGHQWVGDFVLAPGCVRDVLSQKVKSNQGAYQVEATLRCKVTPLKADIEELSVFDGRRWTKDQRQRGIPGSAKLIEFIRDRWVRKMSGAQQRSRAQVLSLSSGGK